MIKDLDAYEHIDEETIRKRAEETNDRALKHLLKIAEEWREADCTPVFIIAQYDPAVVAVVARETFGQPNLIN